MGMQRSLVYDFILLNFAMRSLTGAKPGRLFRSGPLTDQWPKPYKTAALGYEASWAGVFPDPNREGGT